MRRFHQFLGAFIGAVLILIFFLYFFDWKVTQRLLASSDLSTIITALAFLYTAILLRALKWTYILNLLETIPWKLGYHTIMISNMLNFIFPVRLGELSKLYIVRKAGSIAYSSSLSATLTDRFSQLLTLMFFILFTPHAGFRFSQWIAKYTIFLFFIFTLTVSIFLFGEKIFSLLTNYLKKLFVFIRLDNSKIKSVLESRLYNFFHETIRKINIENYSMKHFFLIFLFSVVIVVVDGGCYYFLLSAFSLPINWFQACLAACFMNLTLILPSPPGLVGSAEMYPIVIFAWGLGLAVGAISTAAVLWHIITMSVFVLLGILSTMNLGIDLIGTVRNLGREEINVS